LRTNTVNGKKYVGQVITRRLKKRQKDWDNLNQPYAGNVINNARKKYGVDAFDFEILKECDDKELDFWEKYYVKELNTKVPNGYNMTDGGDGMKGYSPSEETRNKLSKANKGRKMPPRSEEHKKNLSESHKGRKASEAAKKKMSEKRKGENNGMYGKHHSEETKQKIRIKAKGRKASEETKEKMSEIRKGRKHTQKTKNKISEAQKGEKNHMYGKHLSEEAKKKIGDAERGEKHWNYGKHLSIETKNKISESAKGRKASEEAKRKMSESQKNNPKKSKPVLQIDKTTNEVIAEFPSIMEINRQLGYSIGYICLCCNEKRPFAYNYKWKYAV